MRAELFHILRAMLGHVDVGLTLGSQGPRDMKRSAKDEILRWNFHVDTRALTNVAWAQAHHVAHTSRCTRLNRKLVKHLAQSVSKDHADMAQAFCIRTLAQHH